MAEHSMREQSTANRPTRLAALGGGRFDMIVVGGGITGCGIAREATLRGLSVALLEQNDFAGGTSSRSSRLIHGGVRYLEHGHLRLVFEASAERRRLLRLAPHLVQPLRFTWPVYAGARIPMWKLVAGLTLYDLLALFRNVGRHRRLSAKAVLREQPALRSDGLAGGAIYYDACTDDARLTLAVAIDARDRGAAMINHARVSRLITENGRATGVEVRDELTGATVELSAGVIINATGPWSDAFRRLEGPTTAPNVRGSKGAHIAVPHGRIGNNDALTLLSPDDGRVMFILPHGTHTIVGTTDTFTTVAPNETRASEADVAYLLAAANSFFPNARLERRDVIAAWAGIRPLAAVDTGDSVAASREHAIGVTPGGVVTITGGKLTTFRVMAADTVNVALRQLARSAPPSRSERTPLAWDLTKSRDAVVGEATRETGDASLALHLVANYGIAWLSVWRAIESEPGGAERINPALPYRLGEMTYACRAEMAFTLSDLLIRRTRIAFETRDHGRSVAPRVAIHVGPVLGWSAAIIAAEIERYESEITRIFTVDQR
jgi:glycerol-3-phosphate dehydrogenase